MNIRKGDKVKVLYGKDAGKIGSVVAVNLKQLKVIVEGVNIYKRHIKGDGQSKKSEIVKISKPLAVSKVMLVCPKCNKSTRVGKEVKDNKSYRVCKKCGKRIEVVVAAKPEKKETKKPAKKTTTTKKVTKKAKAKKTKAKKTKTTKAKK